MAFYGEFDRVAQDNDRLYVYWRLKSDHAIKQDDEGHDVFANVERSFLLNLASRAVKGDAEKYAISWFDDTVRPIVDAANLALASLPQLDEALKGRRYPAAGRG